MIREFQSSQMENFRRDHDAKPKIFFIRACSDHALGFHSNPDAITAE